VTPAHGQVTALGRTLTRAGVPHRILGSDGPGDRLTLVPVSLAKGLEFDHVIVAEPAAIATGHSRGLHQLYVALTRAVSRLTVLHSQPLPAPLG
jgi:superfamily I DNA/RNA helicase